MIGRLRQRLLGSLAEAVGIERRDRRPWPSTAPVSRIEEHRAAALGAQLLDRRRAARARAMCCSAASSVRWRSLARLGVGERQVGREHRAAARVAQHRAPPGLAGDDLVERRLEAGQTVVVGADVAEHRRRQLAQRVVALALGQEVDARAARGRAPRRPAADRACAPPRRTRGRCASCARELGARRRRSTRASAARRARRVVDLARHRERRVDLDRDRELAAARVVDGAARRIELDHPLLLAHRALADTRRGAPPGGGRGAPPIAPHHSAKPPRRSSDAQSRVLQRQLRREDQLLRSPAPACRAPRRRAARCAPGWRGRTPRGAAGAPPARVCRRRSSSSMR